MRLHRFASAFLSGFGECGHAEAQALNFPS